MIPSFTPFEWLVLGGIYGGLFIVGLALQGIHRLLQEKLEDIREELSGEAQANRDELAFYDRPNKEGESK